MPPTHVQLLNCPLKKGPFDFKGDPSVPTYDCKVDCWSAGVLAYELVGGGSASSMLHCVAVSHVQARTASKAAVQSGNRVPSPRVSLPRSYPPYTSASAGCWI